MKLVTKIIKLSDIKIPEYFGKPNKKKVEKKKAFYNKYRYFESAIVVNNENILIDGYITYIILKKLNPEMVTVVEVEREDY